MQFKYIERALPFLEVRHSIPLSILSFLQTLHHSANHWSDSIDQILLFLTDFVKELLLTCISPSHLIDFHIETPVKKASLNGLCAKKYKVIDMHFNTEKNNGMKV